MDYDDDPLMSTIQTYRLQPQIADDVQRRQTTMLLAVVVAYTTNSNMNDDSMAAVVVVVVVVVDMANKQRTMAQRLSIDYWALNQDEQWLNDDFWSIYYYHFSFHSFEAFPIFQFVLCSVFQVYWHHLQMN